MPSEQKLHHLRFNVPDCDEQVLAFIKMQHNLSTSLRMLIRNYIAKSGYTDVMATSVDETKRAKIKAQSTQQKSKKHSQESTQKPQEQTTVSNTKQQAVARIAAMQGTSQVNDLQSMLNS